MLRKLFGIAMMFITMTAATLGYVTSGPTPAEPTTAAPETVVTAFCNGYLNTSHQISPQAQAGNTLYKKVSHFGVKLIKNLAGQIITFKEQQAHNIDPVARITGGELQNPLATGFYDDMPSLFEYYNVDEDVEALLAVLKEESDRLLFLAHNLPDDFNIVEPGQVKGETATVTVQATWNGSAEPHTLAFTLTRADDAWVIVDVAPLD